MGYEQEFYKMRDFKKYKVWSKSHELALAIYEASSYFPIEETYNLTSQLRRSATTIPTYIAEGCGRDTDAEFKRFLIIASGSARELSYLLILAKDLKILKKENFEILENDVVQVHKSLYTLIKKLNT